ncbi:BON domain-containing protein [Coxiella endosymbiont of Ornithodoros amblus]|uniref:BON domain-containing protein n=1 Tax=Coxiella endosymbiont of Ornithodoros amblus TaxID=1656166 RepID=UPI00244DB167|nr:BON domain-containing protein [Coxiella endosymbiont of Ornithodoros amblus]MBW5802871.1 BON domain-containing protein [Coxiella endosymbiont of Ornithodoros amblus]
MKKLVALLLLTFPLMGCVPAVLLAGAAGATLGGAVVYDQRSYKTMNQDHNARAVIQAEIDRDPRLKGQSHISVSVFNNIALLVGQAKTVTLYDRAYQITTKAPYVRRIHNEITIAIPASAIQRANDSWITTKVRTAMLGKPGLSSSNLKVVTENKIVYLMGIASPRQAAMAAEVARRISGVEKVVKVFEYE